MRAQKEAREQQSWDAETANREQGRRELGHHAASDSPSAFSLQPSALFSRRGFTLTELLVVITIIAILASLASVAVMQGLAAAKQTNIKTELDSLDAAFKAYKEQYGSYPPFDLRITPGTTLGMAGYNAPLRAHVARAFPRYDITQLPNDLALYVDTKNFRPDQAVVFWLGGFSPDPTNPFNNANGGLGNLPKAQRTPAFFNFDPTRLVIIDSTVTPWTGTGTECASYFPQGSKKNVPYVYYDSATIMSLLTISPLLYWFDSSTAKSLNTGVLNAGICEPYSLDLGGGLANPDSFQIISAGTDDLYGVFAINTSNPPPQRFYPSGKGYDLPPSLADDDNVTNFCTKARLGDAKP
jgi:prepilin-type N-terminal cleavage/methylation domain-containing protein